MKVCEVCGKTEKETKVIDSGKFNMIICRKHYIQMQRHGKILERTIKDPNEIIEYEEYAEIVLYDVDCVEKARTKIDLEDVDKVKEYKWSLATGNYVKNVNNEIFIHRLIMNCPDDKIVDHINRDELDNRKSNLRICNKSLNALNSKLSSTNTSGYTGVDFHKSTGKWRARIRCNGKKELFRYF